MLKVNIHEAKTNLSSLLDMTVHTGAPFLIAKYGKPIAKVVPLQDSDISRNPRIGFLEKELADFVMPEDFDSLCQDDIIEMFEGSTL